MRKVLFMKPSGVTRAGKHEYRALVNGEWVYGAHLDVNKKYMDAKREYLKQKQRTKGSGNE